MYIMWVNILGGEEAVVMQGHKSFLVEAIRGVDPYVKVGL